jgi:branched-chain amino acid transport system substrate-binding protein
LLGITRFPINSADFSAQLLTAQGSGANVVAVSSAGNDTLNLIKQWNEYELGAKGQHLVVLSMFPTEITALGLEATQGIRYTTTFYWDLNDETRSLQKRFFERVGHTPTWIQLGVYSSTIHYLRSVEAAGTKDAAKVVAEMHSLPIHDASTPSAWLREDGRVMRPLYSVEVKKPSESHSAWDFERLVSTISAEDSFLPLNRSDCPLVKKHL